MKNAEAIFSSRNDRPQAVMLRELISISRAIRCRRARGLFERTKKCRALLAYTFFTIRISPLPNSVNYTI